MCRGVRLAAGREQFVVSKNIVICLDGTGNQLKAKGNTNVVRLYEMLDLVDPARQIAYYDPGVGTFSAQGAWTPLARRLTKLAGLAVGYGLRTNLAEAYTYLMQEYEEGDRLFVFGFSRGAYTARALVGLLHAVGLLRPGSENLVPYAVGVYARNRTLSRDDWTQLHRFAAAFCRKVDGRTSVPVDFMGLWDSVKAGKEQLVVPLTSTAAVRRAAPVPSALNAIRSEDGHSMAYIFCSSGEDRSLARFFFPVGGAILEDPATGSATANFGAWCVAMQRPLPVRVRISQGEFVKRPSALFLEVNPESQIFVGGDVLELGTGTVTL